MQSSRQGLIPFNELDHEQFEAFVLLFLGAGIALEVIEPGKTAEESPRAARHRLIGASLYGSTGPGGQRGADIVATTDTGTKWVFQCKHYRTRFERAAAEKAVSKANAEFPSAGRYYLILSGEPPPAVRETIKNHERWEIWGGSELSTRFFNEVERKKQIEILRRCFPVGADEIIKRLYPLHDDSLVPVEQYFKKWNQSNRVFNHRAQLVGREDALKELNDFVRDPTMQALILPAAGGVGKTRLLLALGEQFSKEHPDKRFYFVDDAARPETGSDNLRVARDGELVVIHDDAHRMESLRSDLVASLVEKSGKIILATRPHAVDALAGWLSRTSVDANRIRTLPALGALTRAQRVELARQCLPENLKGRAEQLAELAKECTLVITVGAALMAEEGLTPQDYHDSDAFRRAVFDRLETESFVQSVPVDLVSLARKILRLLAVLSPWRDDVLSLKDIGKLLDCTPREFQEIFESLQAAGLLLETRDGWRVVPDLFADDLVYRGCYGDDGRLTEFARRLQEKLVPIASGAVLENLAEAEWQARLRDSGQRLAESIIEPFWQRVKDQVRAVNFLERSEIIKQWKRFSALQPDRSIDLARLAIDLREAPPPPEQYPISEFGLTLSTHRQVLAQVPPLLEPVAIFHSAYREAVLDLLWETHRLMGDSDEPASDGALSAIGNVAKFRVNHTIDAPRAVLAWLDAKLQLPMASEFCDRPAPVLSVILKPIFEREVEDSFREGSTITIRTHPLSIENTRGLRLEALRILQERVIPRGEIATLNALGVLGVAIEGIRLRVREDEASPIVAAWLEERRKALAVVESLVIDGQSPRVLYRIRDVLEHHSQWDRQAKFKDECAKLLRRIPDNEGTRLARVLLSSAWHEFHDQSVQEGEGVGTTDERAVQSWQALADSVARQFLEPLPSDEQLVKALSTVIADYRRTGMQPQGFELLAAVARLQPWLAETCIDWLLTVKEAEIDPWWTALFFAQRRFPDERLLGWIRMVLRDNNQTRWRPLLSLFGWHGMGTIPDAVVKEVGDWAHRLRDDSVGCVLGELQWCDERKAPINEAILCNVDLASLSETSLAKLAGVLSQTVDLKGHVLPAAFVDQFIRELSRVSRLDEYGERPLVGKLAGRQPLRFLEMLIQRIEAAKERRGRGELFRPLPLVSGLVIETLPNIKGYPEQAARIFSGLRTSDDEMKYWWRLLFQSAVLRVSPLGMEFLRGWLPEVRTAEELQVLIQTMDFVGSKLIFLEPDFTRAVLRKAREIAPGEFEKLRWQLGYTASPKMRGYLGHELEPQYRYYREEAARAAIVHQGDPELALLYQEIVRAEDADAARHRHQAELDAIEW